MVASGARKQQRKTAVAAEKVAARNVQSAAGGEEAAATGTVTRGVLVAGTAVKEESDMARIVSVAEAVTAEVEVAAEAATEGGKASGTPEGMVEAAVVRAARAPGAEAGMAVRQAAEIVVGDMEAARGEVTGAVQAMGWVAAEAAIMEVVQAMVDEGVESASRTLGVDLGELREAILCAAHAVVVEVQVALANQFGEVQQGQPAVGTVHQQQAGSGSDEFLSIWSDHIDRWLQDETVSTTEEKATTAAQLEATAETKAQTESLEATGEGEASAEMQVQTESLETKEEASSEMAAQLEAAAESSSTVGGNETAAHLGAAAESSSTGGGSSGVAAEVAEALSAGAAEMQQAAAEGDGR